MTRIMRSWEDVVGIGMTLLAAGHENGTRLKSASASIGGERVGLTTSIGRETSINEWEEEERMRVCIWRVMDGESHRKVTSGPDAVGLGRKVRCKRLCSRILRTVSNLVTTSLLER
jgi:hypothetical protein